jgi:hypothetical protein
VVVIAKEGGPVTSMSMQTAKGSMMGATTAMMKQRKDKERPHLVLKH